MKHLECFDVHELVLDKARVFIRSLVHTFDKNWLVFKDLWQEIFHSSQILLMRERRAVVVLAAPDGDVCLNSQPHFPHQSSILPWQRVPEGGEGQQGSRDQAGELLLSWISRWEPRPLLLFFQEGRSSCHLGWYKDKLWVPNIWRWHQRLLKIQRKTSGPGVFFSNYFGGEQAWQAGCWHVFVLDWRFASVARGGDIEHFCSLCSPENALRLWGRPKFSLCAPCLLSFFLHT